MHTVCFSEKLWIQTKPCLYMIKWFNITHLNTFPEYMKSTFYGCSLPLRGSLLHQQQHAGRHRHASSLFLSLIRMVSLVSSDRQAAKHISQWQVWEQGNPIWYCQGIYFKNRRLVLDTLSNSRLHICYKTWCVLRVLFLPSCVCFVDCQKTWDFSHWFVKRLR